MCLGFDSVVIETCRQRCRVELGLCGTAGKTFTTAFTGERAVGAESVFIDCGVDNLVIGELA